MSTFGDATRRQQLGRALRDLRHAAGFTGMQLAARLGIGQASVSRMEAGLQLPSPTQVDRWAAATGATPAQHHELDQLAEAATVEVVAWRRRPQPLDQLQHLTGDLEESSGLIRGYHPLLVHSLLRVPGYAQVVYQARAQLFGQSDAEVAKAIAGQMTRQGLLYAADHRFEFLVAEAGLRWRFTAPAVLAAQLDRLTQAARMPNVVLGVLPMEPQAPAWAWMGFAAFLERGDDAEDLVLVETLTAELVVRDPAGVDRYDAAFGRLRKLAETGDAAVALLQRIAEELP